MLSQSTADAILTTVQNKTHKGYLACITLRLGCVSLTCRITESNPEALFALCKSLCTSLLVLKKCHKTLNLAGTGQPKRLPTMAWVRRARGGVFPGWCGWVEGRKQRWARIQRYVLSWPRLNGRWEQCIAIPVCSGLGHLQRWPRFKYTYRGGCSLTVYPFPV